MPVEHSRFSVVAAACVLLLAPGRVHSQGMSYGWSISASPSNPYANHIEFPGGGSSTFYLWLVCAPDGAAGMFSAEFGLQIQGGALASFTPGSGFLNAGTAANLLLTAGSCPAGPVVVGEILVLVAAPGNLCLTTSDGGMLGTEDCASPPPVPDTWRGLDFGGAFCFQGYVCQTIDAVYPCCFPNGTCSEIPAIEFEQHCLGVGGYGPPVQFCEDWDCAAVAAPGGMEAGPWGRVKASYRGR